MDYPKNITGKLFGSTRTELSCKERIMQCVKDDASTTRIGHHRVDFPSNGHLIRMDI